MIKLYIIIKFFNLIIVICFFLTTLSLNHKEKINEENVGINELEYDNKDLYINDLQELENISKNIKCKRKRDKIFYKNETSLNIEKIRKEINSYSKINIPSISENKFPKNDFPKISIIITIYNQEKYVNLIYLSILNQSLKDIEIIFIDDASTDHSSQKIKKLCQNDKRIIFIKNKKNRRAFYSRNRGILHSRGEYLIIIDPDDLLINNILIKAYITAKKYNLDIVQFYIMIGHYNKSRLWLKVKYRDGILCDYSVKKLFYYGKSRNLVDKLIKRDIYLKSISFMRKEFYDLNYYIHDDDTAFFGVIKYAKSYGFLEQIGYFYKLKEPGEQKSRYEDIKNINIIYLSLFNIMKYFYVQSENSTLEKNLIAFKFFNEKVENEYKRHINKLTEGFDYILEILNLYLNSEYLDEAHKSVLSDFKLEIQNRKNEISDVKKL